MILSEWGIVKKKNAAGKGQRGRHSAPPLRRRPRLGVAGPAARCTPSHGMSLCPASSARRVAELYNSVTPVSAPAQHHRSPNLLPHSRANTRPAHSHAASRTLGGRGGSRTTTLPHIAASRNRRGKTTDDRRQMADDSQESSSSSSSSSTPSGTTIAYLNRYAILVPTTTWGRESLPIPCHPPEASACRPDAPSGVTSSVGDHTHPTRPFDNEPVQS